MSVSKKFKWVTGVLEIILAIPVLGASILMNVGFGVLLFMLVLHIVTLILTIKDNGTKIGSILGIITSCIAWFPTLNMVPHILTAFFLIMSALTPDGTDNGEKQVT